MSSSSPDTVSSFESYKGAELLTCALIRTNKAKKEVGWAVNAFSVLRFHDNPSLVPHFEFITPKPERLPSGTHQLMISLSRLTVDEAISFARFSGGFRNPRVPESTPPIEAPGIWLAPEFVGRDEHRVRALVGVPESFMLHECWRTGQEIEDEIGADGVQRICRRINELTEVDLSLRKERLGNFIITMPAVRHRMRVWLPRKTKLGIELRTLPLGPERFLLLVRSSRHGSLLASHHRNVREGLHIFDVPEFADHREIELYDADNGHIIDREAGSPLRSIEFTTHQRHTPVDIAVTFADGSPPVHAKTMWGTTRRTEVGSSPEPWERELADVRERERRERLRETKDIIVYRGSEAERQQAIVNIREILGSSRSRYFKIWDPYFSAREAVEFLPFVTDPTTPIQILTSLELTPNEKHQRQTPRPSRRFFCEGAKKITGRSPISRIKGAAKSSPIRQRKKVQLGQALSMLRNPRPGITGLSALQCRVGAEMFHDRFIITDQDCWQLGCSLNQIGNVMSTIVKFPHPSLIEREFDRSWHKMEAL